MRSLNVLSLFDGISAGREALWKIDMPVRNYWASEIDKFAIRVSEQWGTLIQQVGDVTAVYGNNLIDRQSGRPTSVDLLLGGSPCQGFSHAGTRLNFDDPRSALLAHFLRLKDEVRPVYWLLENVPMASSARDDISKMLGRDAVEINSASFSAQHRKRLYWTNIPILPYTETSVRLSDILIKRQSMVDSLVLSDREVAYMNRKTRDGRTHWDFNHHSDSSHDKSRCVVANWHKGVPYNVLVDGRVKRKFHPVEVERLQTFRDNYTSAVSKTQSYKLLGNSWTVDVVAHILKGIYHA